MSPLRRLVIVTFTNPPVMTGCAWVAWGAAASAAARPRVAIHFFIKLLLRESRGRGARRRSSEVRHDDWRPRTTCDVPRATYHVRRTTCDVPRAVGGWSAAKRATAE